MCGLDTALPASPALLALAYILPEFHIAHKDKTRRDKMKTGGVPYTVSQDGCYYN